MERVSAVELSTFFKGVPDLSWKERRQGKRTRRWMFLMPTKSLRVWNSVKLFVYIGFDYL